MHARVLVTFYKFQFTGLLRYMQLLPWEIGFLGCRFQLLGCISAVKIITLMWRPAKSPEHCKRVSLQNLHYDNNFYGTICD